RRCPHRPGCVALDVRAPRGKAGTAAGGVAADRPRVLGPVLRAVAGNAGKPAARDLLAHDQQLPVPVPVPDRAPDRVPARGEAARRGERKGVRARGVVREGAAGSVDGARDGKTGGGGADARGDGCGAPGGGRVTGGGSLPSVSPERPPLRDGPSLH